MKCILIVLLLLAFPVSTAAAAPVNTPVNLRGHDITAKKVFKYGEDPADPGHCVTALFAEFPDRKHETATHWYTHIYADRPDAQHRSIDEAIDPPYDDVFTFGGITWRAPKGKHWALISTSWADGPPSAVEHCARAYGKYPQIFRDPVKVRYEYTTSGYIAGYVSVVPAWGGGPYSSGVHEKFPAAEMTKLLTGLRIKAKGKHRTFTAPVLPDGAENGYYIIKVPKKDLGPFKISPVTPAGIALEPESLTTTLTPGRVFKASYKTGYDCSAKPPGMKFVPTTDRFFRRDGVGVEYNCRSRRLAMGFATDYASSYDAQSKALSCRWPDGSQAPNSVRDRFDSLPMPLQSGGAFSGVGAAPYVPKWANGTFGELEWKGHFVRPDRLLVEVRNAACRSPCAARCSRRTASPRADRWSTRMS